MRVFYSFVYISIFSVHLRIYSVPNGTLASKLKILYFLPPFCPKFCPFRTFLSFHILFMAYTVQFWYCFICTTIMSVHLWIYSVPIGKFALKLTIFNFLPPFCPIFGPFCNFKSVYNLSMPCKLCIWYCFVCETIFSVHLWIYSVPNGKLASKLKILYFLPLFCPKFCPF